MNQEAEAPKPIPHPHAMISGMVDEMLEKYGSELTQEQFAEFVQSKPESWGWVFGCLGQKPALKFFSQLFDMRKAAYETPTN